MSAGLGAFTPHTDRRFLLLLGGLVLLVIVAVSLIAPSTAANDPRPSSYNTAPGGGKAAYLTLEATGRTVARWDRPLEDLASADAAQTTLILADPLYSALEKDRLAAALQSFLDNGGHLLTTGAGGALLIPGGTVGPGRRFNALCYTEPEGPGPLAAAGRVEMKETVRWSDERPAVRVEQRCGADAVAVRLPVGRGEAIWWSSASPLTNAELHQDADLKLLLASLGPGRRVLFDESLGQPVRSKWSATHGLPLLSLLAQAALVFALLVFSFSRRNGPVRLPVSVPRSSPVEFATSMGDLYERAGATGVAVDAARRRLARVLVRTGGLAQRSVDADPAGIPAALTARFGGEWTSVGEHLRAAADTGEAPLTPRSALALVRALYEDACRVQVAAHPAPVAAQGAVPAAAPLHEEAAPLRGGAVS